MQKNGMSRMTLPAIHTVAVQMGVSSVYYHTNDYPVTKPSSTVPKLRNLAMNAAAAASLKKCIFTA